MAGKKFSPLQLISVFQSLVCQVRSPHWTPIFLAGFRNTVHARVREIWKISRVVVMDFSRRAASLFPWRGIWLTAATLEHSARPG